MTTPAFRATALAVMALAASYSNSASADELSDIKAQMEMLQKRLADVEARQRAPAPAPAPAPVTAAAPAPAVVPQAAIDEAVAKSMKGTLPRSFKIPGTDTSIRLGGYIKLDTFEDFGPEMGDAPAYSQIPLNGTAAGSRKHTLRINGRETRITIGTDTPVGGFRINTYFEGDFYGTGGTEVSTNAAGIRLRRAYVAAGPFLFGQENSVAIDLQSIPETLDFSGPAGRPYLRVPQIRYTKVAGPHTVIAAFENPESDFVGGTTANTFVPTALGAISGPNVDHYPDLVTSYSYTKDWGHIGTQGVLRRLSVNTGTVKSSTTGYMVALSGSLNTGGKDTAIALYNYGRGAARYFSETPGQSASFDGLHLKNQTEWAGTVGYRHYWTDTTRSTLVYSLLAVDNNVSVIGNTFNRRISSVHGNFIATLYPNLDLGAEFTYANRKLDSGLQGTGRRLMVSAKYAY